MKRRTWAAGLGGAALALLATGAYETVRYLAASPAVSTQAVDKPLGEFSVNPRWILAGQPVFRGAETLRSADGQTVSGLWLCEGPTSFEWHFAADETVHLLEGGVEVEYLGRRFSLSPGDTATFHAGTKAVWHVPTHAKKAYTLHQPGVAVRAWRKLARAWGDSGGH